MIQSVWIGTAIRGGQCAKEMNICECKKESHRDRDNDGRVVVGCQARGWLLGYKVQSGERRVTGGCVSFASEGRRAFSEDEGLLCLCVCVSVDSDQRKQGAFGVGETCVCADAFARLADLSPSVRTMRRKDTSRSC